MALYSSSGSVLANAASTTDNETVILSLRSGRRYYVRVTGASGAANGYAFTVDKLNNTVRPGVRIGRAALPPEAHTSSAAGFEPAGGIHHDDHIVVRAAETEDHNDHAAAASTGAEVRWLTGLDPSAAVVRDAPPAASLDSFDPDPVAPSLASRPDWWTPLEMRTWAKRRQAVDAIVADSAGRLAELPLVEL
jgi:hypothetical protein